jgi:septum formation protein
MPRLILASTSRYRREQLARLGVPFDAIAPTCDEDALKRAFLADGASNDRPLALARHLASAKAASVAAAHPDAVVIGGDQLGDLDGEILGKPGSRERAIEQLLRMSGRTHRLVTAICVHHPGGIIERIDLTRLTMRQLDRPAVERYVDADQPVDCAGSYKLELRGIALFERIDSADFTAITGLPLITLAADLAGLGFPVP